MVVTRTFAALPERFFQQIDNIIKSHSLRGSESLCKLLQYLAKQSLYHPDAPLKEYQIATEVYGRPTDFDPQSDSTIRVQAVPPPLATGAVQCEERVARALYLLVSSALTSSTPP